MRLRFFALILFAVVFMTGTAYAFKIKPVATEADGTVIKVENSGRSWDRLYPIFVDMFTQPVHERITNNIYGCAAGGESDTCGNSSNGQYAPEAVLAGVRWNDNPPFKLDSGGRGIDCPLNETIKLPRQTKCWYGLFKDAEKHATDPDTFYNAQSGNVILYRIHFGDMQFVHSMASKENEPAKKTRDDIMMWAEFAYKVAHGDINRGAEIRSTGIAGIDTLMGGKGTTVQQLFVRGDRDFQDDQPVRDFAFGTLLHMVEDSFSPSHTDREDPSGARCPGDIDQPGRIKSFHSYVNQDKTAHARGDLENALISEVAQSRANAIYIGKALKSLYDSKKSWDEVRPFMECLYELETPAVISGPGAEFTMR